MKQTEIREKLDNALMHLNMVKSLLLSVELSTFSNDDADTGQAIGGIREFLNLTCEKELSELFDGLQQEISDQPNIM